MNDLTNHGVPRAFQLLWRRRPRVAAASWCKRRYGREREWRSRVGLTECGKCGSGTSVDTNPRVKPDGLPNVEAMPLWSADVTNDIHIATWFSKEGVTPRNKNCRS